MEIRTFRAKSMREALDLVRKELGVDAAVLHTREVRARRLFGLLSGTSEIEVTASADVPVPSRLPPRPLHGDMSTPETDDHAGEGTRHESPRRPGSPLRPPSGPSPSLSDASPTDRRPGPRPQPPSAYSEPPGYGDTVTTIDWRRNGDLTDDYVPKTHATATAVVARPDTHPPRSSFNTVNQEIQDQLNCLQAMLEDLYQRSRSGSAETLPDTMFHVFTELIEADLSEEVARALVDQARQQLSSEESSDPQRVKSHIARQMEESIPTGGPIALRQGRPQVVALVGPTGVGKTTTIAKLAAHYRLKEKRKVGFITVDTYRIAAVEQLRTYAEIIDLPMEVVSTPCEMRQAITTLDDMDLILVDTAGRSPHDEIRIRELKTLLAEAGTDEVHLVLSAVAGARVLRQTIERFALVGADNLILTKLDEASGLGHLFPLVRDTRLPLRYWTTGQNVPDDIETATAARAAQLFLSADTLHRETY